MRRSGWFVSLTPSGVSVGTPGGALAHVSADPREWEEAWEKDLRPFDSVLERAIRDAGVSPGTNVDLVYAGRDSLTEIYTYDLRPGEAVAAARLAVADQFQGGTDGNPESAGILAVEAPAGRVHVLGCAEQDHVAEMLADWVERAQLRVGRIVPARAAAIAEATRTLLNMSEKGPVANVYIGAHFACIAAARGQELALVRAIDLGYDSLIEAMSRGHSHAREGVRSLQIRDDAREALLSVGIPSRTRTFDPACGLVAERILPLIQPVLQRYVVEIRQTLRFALGETDMSRIRLVLSGPGASIIGLDEVVESSMDIEVELMPSCPRGEIDALVRHGEVEIDLAPQKHVSRRCERSLGRMLAVGVLAGAAAIGCDAALTLSAISDLRTHIDANQIIVDEGRVYQEKLARMAQLSDRVARIEQELSVAIGRRADWAGVVQELGLLTSDRVRLTEFAGGFREGRPHAQIKGMAFAQAQGDKQDPLREFIGAVMNSPWAGEVEIGSTRSAQSDGRSAVVFALTAEVRRPTISATATEGGGQR